MLKTVSKIIPLAAVLLLSACAQSPKPEAGSDQTPETTTTAEPVAEQMTLPYNSVAMGSLVSDNNLINAALDEMANHVIEQGCQTPESYEPFILQKPSGAAGSLKWQELWVMHGCKKEFPMQINFAQTSAQSLSYT
ncbi:MAG: hypothetical protein ACPHV3_06855, partial [Vibrio sp.]